LENAKALNFRSPIIVWEVIGAKQYREWSLEFARDVVLTLAVRSGIFIKKLVVWVRPKTPTD